jgi:hypothetical protein
MSEARSIRLSTKKSGCKTLREAIELLLQARTVTKAWIVDQLVELARTKATDLYEWSADTGLRLKDSDEIDPDNIGAVAEIRDAHH